MSVTRLDRSESDALVNDSGAQAGDLARLVEIMARLRDPQTGCPWDVEQTPASIAHYCLEEAHEVVDAIEREAWDELKGELGDLLLQVVFHARMAEEAGRFDLTDVMRGISDKMIARHPHVFGEESRDKSPDQQRTDWEEIKARERGAARVLDGVAMALPALSRAVKLQNRAARVGFDWQDAGDVLAKITEEAAEVVEARDQLTEVELAEEMGDLFFVMANLARHLKVDPEAALRAANQKFTRRFNQIEDWLADEGRSPAQSTLAEMDRLWDQAKAKEKTAKA